jgi:hypothetical protein
MGSPAPHCLDSRTEAEGPRERGHKRWDGGAGDRRPGYRDAITTATSGDDSANA